MIENLTKQPKTGNFSKEEMKQFIRYFRDESANHSGLYKNNMREVLNQLEEVFLRGNRSISEENIKRFIDRANEELQDKNAMGADMVLIKLDKLFLTKIINEEELKEVVNEYDLRMDDRKLIRLKEGEDNIKDYSEISDIIGVDLEDQSVKKQLKNVLEKDSSKE